ncbi:MAG: cache domain-containing protein, partial [Spirochaetia bacterium]
MSETHKMESPTEGPDGPPKRPNIARSALAIFLPAFVLTLVLTAALLLSSHSAEMTVRRAEQRFVVALQAESMIHGIAEVFSDLAILVDESETDRLWDDEGKMTPEGIADLTQEYMSLLMHRGLYDQVRLIDENGMEIVRVNFNEGRPAIVPQGELQNKRGRYYFDDAFRLGRGEVFVSPLDLNIEHGEIEQPLKPMIRFATPVFDRRGEKRGILLLNYFGATLLAPFVGRADPSKGGRAMLLNADGYWLHGPNPDDEWGFMYEDRSDRTFAAAYPEAWERIGSEESSQFE